MSRIYHTLILILIMIASNSSAQSIVEGFLVGFRDRHGHGTHESSTDGELHDVHEPLKGTGIRSDASVTGVAPENHGDSVPVLPRVERTNYHAHDSSANDPPGPENCFKRCEITSCQPFMGCTVESNAKDKGSRRKRAFGERRGHI
eukprot:TRINITY_DN11802_c0_g1_i5.p1 TRINITY_DN11802_c0_g1~~TRINITY_DN11802_c0_g1_i5.p1  ORF type:complete len:146 (+),score=1.83 TRINITY_DN11802_c0_g1_i5:90-527(+)